MTTMLNEGLSVQDIMDKILDKIGGEPPSLLVPSYGPCEPVALREVRRE